MTFAVAGEQRRETADACLLGSREVARNESAGLRRDQLGEEPLAVDAHVVGKAGQHMLVRGVLVLGIERALDALLVGQRQLRIDEAHRHHGPARGLGVVDPALPLEQAEVERLARRLANLAPVTRDHGLVGVGHRLGVAGTQATHQQAYRQTLLEVGPDAGNDRRKAVAPRAHRVGDVEQVLLHLRRVGHRLASSIVAVAVPCRWHRAKRDIASHVRR